jgi:hypothetical protein
MSVRKEVVDIQVSANAANSASPDTFELPGLDVGQYKLIEVVGWLTSANTGAGPAITCSRVRSGTAVTVVAGMSESTQALQAAAAAGTAIYATSYGNSGDFRSLIFVPGDQLRVTTAANTGACEIHARFVRV